MKDEQIEFTIDSINDGSYAGWIYHHHLAANVHFVRGWIEFSNGSLSDIHGYDFTGASPS